MVPTLILSPTHDHPPERSCPVPIPRPAPGTAKWWVVATISILLGCAMAVWFGLASTLGLPSWTDLGYRVIDDKAVDVTYLVSRPIGRDVTCVIQAMDRSFGTAGLVEVHVPGSDTSSVKRTTRVRTTTRAVTGVVKSCSIG
jgi:Domain of unknown function (DUF4307)